jgi:hypothetical protein
VDNETTERGKTAWRSRARRVGGLVVAPMMWLAARRPRLANFSLRPLVPVLSAVFAFIDSRRWLVGAILITVGLLTVVLVTRPTAHIPFVAAEDPDVDFDDVKTLPTGSGPIVRSGLDREGRAGHGLVKIAARSDGPTFDAPPLDDDPKVDDPMRFSHRLNAVRSRQARGAWLTGRIEEMAELSPAPATAQKLAIENRLGGSGGGRQAALRQFPESLVQ